MSAGSCEVDSLEATGEVASASAEVTGATNGGGATYGTLTVTDPGGLMVGGNIAPVPYDTPVHGDRAFYDVYSIGSTNWTLERQKVQTPTYAANMTVLPEDGTEIYIGSAGNLTTWSIGAGQYSGQEILVIVSRGSGSCNITTPSNTVWPLAVTNAQDGLTVARTHPITVGLDPGDRGFFYMRWSGHMSKWIVHTRMMENPE